MPIEQRICRLIQKFCRLMQRIRRLIKRICRLMLFQHIEKYIEFAS